MEMTKVKIAARLEEAFASGGFAELGVDDLRKRAEVSLRTLYKYFPSRADMVLAALEHRHERYLAHLFTDLPETREAALKAIFERVGEWMHQNAPQGCLFHSAVAAHPNNRDLKNMLERHKGEVANRMVHATGLWSAKTDLLLLHEGLTQSWSLFGYKAVERAQALAKTLLIQCDA